MYVQVQILYRIARVNSLLSLKRLFLYPVSTL
jgi:hypothetical protein